MSTVQLLTDLPVKNSKEIILNEINETFRTMYHNVAQSYLIIDFKVRYNTDIKENDILTLEHIKNSPTEKIVVYIGDDIVNSITIISICLIYNKPAFLKLIYNRSFIKPIDTHYLKMVFGCKFTDKRWIGKMILIIK